MLRDMQGAPFLSGLYEDLVFFIEKQDCKAFTVLSTLQLLMNLKNLRYLWGAKSFVIKVVRVVKIIKVVIIFRIIISSQQSHQSSTNTWSLEGSSGLLELLCLCNL